LCDFQLLGIIDHSNIIEHFESKNCHIEIYKLTYMIEQRAYKIRIYPDATQQRLLMQSFGCRRWLHNYRLAERKEQWDAVASHYEMLNKPDWEGYDGNKKLYNKDMKAYEVAVRNRNRAIGAELKLEPRKSKSISALRKEFPWLKDVDSDLLAQADMDVYAAFKNFYAGTACLPKKHKKNRRKQSYRTQCRRQGTKYQSIRFNFEESLILLPKLGWVRFSDNRTVGAEWRMTACTLSMEAGRFFASCLLTRQVQAPQPVDTKSKDLKVVGLDMSLSSFYVDSDGNEAPGFVAQYRKGEHGQAVIAKWQKRIAKKDANRKSRRGLRRRLTLQKHFWKQRNLREHYLECESARLARDADVVCVEGLNMREMSQTCNLGKSVMDLGWGRFVTRLKEKLSQAGKFLVVADKWFASSKTCNVCGCKNSAVVLGVKEWQCPECGALHQRDPNAAKNLRTYAVRSINGQIENCRVYGCTHERGEGDGGLPNGSLAFAFTRKGRADGRRPSHRQGAFTRTKNLPISR
jgi:putative transposase